MSTISIMHTKGGVGKTTSAIFLAAAAARRGREVVVVDGDPQGSAVAWAKEAADRGHPLPFEVIPAGARLDSNPGYLVGDDGLVLIDTPPGTAGIIGDSIAWADIVIVPCGASPIDAQRVWPTLEITEGTPTIVLLTAVDLRSHLWTKVKAALQRELVPVAGTMISQRSSIKRAFGRAPSELFGYDDLLTELEAVL